MTAFLLDNELEDDLKAAIDYSLQWQEPFYEYERIASNQPSPALPENYDRVTDGTLSALMWETAMRIWGQMQTGRVVQLPTDNQDFPEWKTEVANILWKNKIIKNADTMAPFFIKLVVASHKAYTYGGQPAFCFPKSTRYYNGADFTLPPVRDVKVPSGYVTPTDAPRLWFLRHYDKIQFRGLIEAAKNAKDNLGFNVAKLEEIYESNAFEEKTEDRSFDEEGKSKLGQKVTLATCYQRGYKAPWITVYPKGNGDDSNIVRREVNDIITGDIPIVFMHDLQNFVNPYGISQVELAGPSQNMVDLLTAGHSLGLRKAIDPATQVKGDYINDEAFDIDTLVEAPGNLMFTGNVEIEHWTPDPAILAAFPNQISSYKTNVMNLQGTSDGTISATSSGNTMYSKTPAGVKQQEGRTDAKDNFRRMNADLFVANLARVLINMTIQRTSGSEVIDITEEQRDKLIAAGFEVPEGQMQIVAEFEELREGEFDFDVDGGSSKLEDDAATKQAVSDAIETTMNIQDLDARLAKEGKKFNLGALLANYYDKSGIDNVDKIITPLSPEEQTLQENQETAAQDQAAAAVQDMQMQQEQEKLAQEQLKTQAQVAKTAQVSAPTDQPQAAQTGDGSEDALVAERLRGEGWTDEQIAAYLQRERSV